MQLNTIDEYSEYDSSSTRRLVKREVKVKPKRAVHVKFEAKLSLREKKPSVQSELIKETLDKLSSQLPSLLSKREETDKQPPLTGIVPSQRKNSKSISFTTGFPDINQTKSRNLANSKSSFQPSSEYYERTTHHQSNLTMNRELTKLKSQLEMLSGKQVLLKDFTDRTQNSNSNDILLINPPPAEETNLEEKTFHRTFDLPVDRRVNKVLRKYEHISSKKVIEKVVKLDEKTKGIDKFKQKLHIAAEDKREKLKFISYKRKVRSKVTKLINNDTYFLCNAFSQHIDTLNKKIVFTNDLLKNNLKKKNHFDTSRSNPKNYIFNLNHIIREHSDPEKLFHDNLSKPEMRLIRDDPKYYIQDKKYLDNVRYFSNRSLIEKLRKEERIVDKMKAKHRKNFNSWDMAEVLNHSEVLTQTSISDNNDNMLKTFSNFSSDGRVLSNSISYLKRTVKQKEKPKRVIRFSPPKLKSRMDVKKLKNLKFNDISKKELVLSNSKLDSYLRVQNRNQNFSNKIMQISLQSKHSVEEKNMIDIFRKEIKENMLDLNVKILKNKNNVQQNLN